MYLQFALVFFLASFLGFTWSSRYKPYENCSYPVAAAVSAGLGLFWPLTISVFIGWILWLTFGDCRK